MRRNTVGEVLLVLVRRLSLSNCGKQKQLRRGSWQMIDFSFCRPTALLDGSRGNMTKGSLRFLSRMRAHTHAHLEKSNAPSRIGAHKNNDGTVSPQWMKCQAFVTLSLPISYHDMFNTCKYVLENAKSIFIICLKNNVLNIISAHCVWGDLFEFRAVANNLWCLEYLKIIIFWGGLGGG